MAEVTTLRHLGRMQSCRGGELRGQSQRGETVLASQEVDVREDILFERAHDAFRALPDRACRGRTGPEPDGGEGESKTKEGTAGHALEIGLRLENFRRALRKGLSHVAPAGSSPRRCRSQSTKITWSEPATGIAASAPSTPASWAPISTAMSTTRGESCTVFP